MKKYQVIYADCPWRYNFCKDNSDKIERHYPTMDLEELKSLNIPADKNSVLFLWATAPKLLEALYVMRAWGFKYKTQGIWDKEWIGMGYWFRGPHEILLVGTKGKFSPPSFENRESSVYKERRTKHSKKPHYYRKWIERSFPNFRKLELFAREKVEGWTSLGYDINGKNIKEALQDLTDEKI